MPYTFPITIDQLKSNYSARNYPCVLTDDGWQAVADQAMVEFDKYAPLTTWVTFQGVANQTDYYVFNPDDPQTQVAIPNTDPVQYQAACTNALSITDIFWNPGGDWSSLNIYSPGWQMLSQMILFTGSYFHNPSQMAVLRQKLDYWKKQFGEQGFEVFGQPGDPAAFLRVYPEPQEDGANILVEYTQAYSLSYIGQSWFRYFELWFNYYLCLSIADYYSESAGVQLLGFTDSKAAMVYWQSRADKAYTRAMATLAGNQGYGERS